MYLYGERCSPYKPYKGRGGIKQEKEKGFIRSLFSSESFKGNYQVIVREVSENSCMVTIVSDGEDSELYERDLLSEINQSLS